MSAHGDLTDVALSIAATGLPVFPCSALKRPAIPKRQAGAGFHDATCDPEHIRELWQRAGNKAKLIGVPTGIASGLDILDIDPRHNGDAWETENLARLPQTRIHQTPSGGRHYVFRHVDGVRNSSGKLAPGVDVRGQGGYACYPPLGGYSVIHEAEPADWPDWLLPLVLKASELPPRPEPSAYTSPAEITDKRLQAFIRSAIDHVAAAQEGAKHITLRDAALQIGGVAERAGLSDREALQLLLAALPDTVRDWDNARRTAAWGLTEGRKRPIELPDREQFRVRGRQQGNGPQPPEPPEPQPDDPGPQPPEPRPDDPVTTLITEFNAKYFVLNENGRAIIYAPKHDPNLNRRFFERITFTDLGRLYSNRLVKVGEEEGQPVFLTAAKVWLTHRDRRQFIGGVVFDPSSRRHDHDILNLWRGFAVEPRPGSWGALKHHVRSTICRNDIAIFDYLLDWMADLVRHPGKQGEVCVVLCGPEGAGKGILARALKYLLGQHGLAISNSRHLTGNFNAHLRDVVFLFADEAFYAGDKAHVGVLKSLITEPYLTIEGKYQDAVQVPNYLHIMMASNETWVVPASLRSRRWLVLDVDDNHANDHGYFGAIQAELEHGGYEAMLHELLNRPPSDNLRKIPVTAALQTQRKLSLGTTDGWWLDCLHRGYVFRSKVGLENYFSAWHEVVATDLLADSYAEYCRAHHERHPLSRELLGKWLRTMDCKPIHQRDMVVGEHIGEVITPDGHTHRSAELVTRDRAHGYRLGSLDLARQAFSRTTGLEVEWTR